MAAMPEAYDLTCVIHVHSTHSDGTGTVAQIARAAARAGVDVVLLTDHDTLAAKRAGEERWYGDVLVLVGEEVSPINRDHFLAFGIDKEISRRLSGPEICAAVRAAGGFGFAAHPFSRGSERFKRPPIAFGELDCLDGRTLGLVVEGRSAHRDDVDVALSGHVATERDRPDEVRPDEAITEHR